MHGNEIGFARNLYAVISSGDLHFFVGVLVTRVVEMVQLCKDKNRFRTVS